MDALCSLETKFADPQILYVCNIFIFSIKKVGVVKNTRVLKWTFLRCLLHKCIICQRFPQKNDLKENLTGLDFRFLKKLLKKMYVLTFQKPVCVWVINMTVSGKELFHFFLYIILAVLYQ